MRGRAGKGRERFKETCEDVRGMARVGQDIEAFEWVCKRYKKVKSLR